MYEKLTRRNQRRGPEQQSSSCADVRHCVVKERGGKKTLKGNRWISHNGQYLLSQFSSSWPLLCPGVGHMDGKDRDPKDDASETFVGPLPRPGTVSQGEVAGRCVVVWNTSVAHSGDEGVSSRRRWVNVRRAGATAGRWHGDEASRGVSAATPALPHICSHSLRFLLAASSHSLRRADRRARWPRVAPGAPHRWTRSRRTSATAPRATAPTPGERRPGLRCKESVRRRSTTGCRAGRMPLVSNGAPAEVAARSGAARSVPRRSERAGPAGQLRSIRRA